MAIDKIQSESINLADTFAFTGTVTGAGESNVPSFLAYLSSNQSISGSTETKIQCNTEVYDTASAYDNSSNYRFTPQTAGKYFVYCLIDHSWTGDWGDQRKTSIKKNSTQIAIKAHYDRITSAASYGGLFISATCSMNGSSDYLEAFGYSNASGPIFVGGLSTTYFGAYLIST